MRKWHLYAWVIPIRTPTHIAKVKKRFSMFSSQEIWRSAVSFEMIFEALQFEWRYSRLILSNRAFKKPFLRFDFDLSDRYRKFLPLLCESRLFSSEWQGAKFDFIRFRRWQMGHFLLPYHRWSNNVIKIYHKFYDYRIRYKQFLYLVLIYFMSSNAFYHKKMAYFPSYQAINLL